MRDLRADPVVSATGQPDRVLTVQDTDTVHEAAEQMRDWNVGALVVTDEHSKVVGITTERDLLNRVLAAHQDPRSVLVREVMTSDVATCGPNMSLTRAQEIMMSRQIRHLPLVDAEGKAVGMISSRDIMAHQVQADRAMRAAAEQVAMLSTGLKSLDFEEVVNLVTREVPKLFHAKQGILFFPADDCAEGPLLLASRSKCPCPDEDIIAREDVKEALQSGRVHYGDASELCGPVRDDSSHVLIPLDVHGLSRSRGVNLTSRGVLCMCGMEGSSEDMQKLIRYKGALVREVLNSNLTNAKLYQNARQDALTDALTAVGSRRLFEERLESELARCQRYKRPLSLVMVDIDDFKSINDSLGHIAGDDALCAFAELLRLETRTSDVLARFGGDEFVLLMPETDLGGAVTIADRIRAATEELDISEGVHMTTSCGVAQFLPDSELTGKTFVRHADLALYEAKKAGRNRVEVWERVAGRLTPEGFVETEKVTQLQRRVDDMSARSKEMFVQSIWGLIQALEARDKYTRSHSENVMRYAVGIAETLGITGEETEVIRRAAMIHDIGKIGVPDHILRKPGKLTDEERQTMQQHPLIAVAILRRMQFLGRELPIVRAHHERWDGTGYPDGIAAAAVPRGARVLAVADAFDAVTSDRLYRKARPVSRALEILQECSGSQFDPEVATAMAAWVQQVATELDKPGRVTAQDLLDSQKAPVVAA